MAKDGSPSDKKLIDDLKKLTSESQLESYASGNDESKYNPDDLPPFIPLDGTSPSQESSQQQGQPAPSEMIDVSDAGGGDGQGHQFGEGFSEGEFFSSQQTVQDPSRGVSDGASPTAKEMLELLIEMIEELPDKLRVG